MKKLSALLKERNLNNALWLYMLQICNTILPLITLPYVTRILGTEKYGIFSIAINMIGYLQCIVEYGFAMSATRKVALMEENEKYITNKLFTNILLSRCVLFVFCALFVGVYLLCNGGMNENGICLCILTVTILGFVIQLNWLFQGKQEMKFLAIPNVFARVITTVGIFALVKKASDIYLYCFLYSIIPLISGVVGLVYARRRYSLRLVKVTLHEVIDEMKEGWYVFTTQLSSKVFGAIGITFLGFFVTSAEAGIYSAVQKIPYIMMLAWGPISQILYPISSRKLKESFADGYKYIYRIRKYTLTLFGALAFLIGIFGKDIITIAFGIEYAVGYYLIYPLLLWVLLGINNNFLGIQIMLGCGCDKEYSSCFQIGVVFTIILNYVLIYLYGIDGAAVAPFASEFILGILLWCKLRKIKERRNF